MFSTLFPQRAPGQRLCNIAACDREYRSFRASDCTYRSYSGRRKVCEIGVAPSQEAAFGAFTPRAQRTAPAASCNVRSCQREYRSFRASDCTYQPYRGPRRLCTR
uniref:BA14K family protein n=1 Tax=Aquibium pacificus TaxID=3153579 RepID=UPI0035A165A0